MRDAEPESASNLVLEIALTRGSTVPDGLTAREIAEACYSTDDSYAIDTYKRRVGTMKTNGYLSVVNPDEPGPQRLKITLAGKAKFNSLGLYTQTDDRVDARPR